MYKALIRPNKFWVTVAIWLALWAVVPSAMDWSASAGQTEEKRQSLPPEARARIRQATAAVGLILVRRGSDPANQNPRPRGSAVIIRKDGVVVTSYHVIREDDIDRLYDDVFFYLNPIDAVPP